MHTSIEHRRVSCRGALISGCQKPYAHQASNRADWCSPLLKMSPTASAAQPWAGITTGSSTVPTNACAPA
ncbi:hypothetical protein IPC582_22140 [Pseudomonas aeruginosa]|nr:hypothetical protein IPC582_22140 [Pseudomonas aeruginosa]